jgi:hypothetical protein
VEVDIYTGFDWKQPAKTQNQLMDEMQKKERVAGVRTGRAI